MGIAPYAPPRILVHLKLELILSYRGYLKLKQPA